jgi:outer membrane protein
MKPSLSSLTRILVFVLALSPLSLFAQQAKIGCVDMSKIFPEYYRTKKAEAEMNDALSAVQKELATRQTELTKMNDDLKKLSEDAQNPAFTDTKRAEKKKAMESKRNDCIIYENSARTWSQERGQELLKKRNETMQALVDDIIKVIKEKASKEGYTMIVDKSSISPKGSPPIPVPSFLYLQDSIDLTADILKTLNASAPAGSSTSPATDKSKEKAK